MERNTGSTRSFRWTGVVQDAICSVLVITSRNDLKAVETIMEIKAVYLFISCKNNGIKALIVLKSIYLLIEWPQLILRVKFSKLRPNFRSLLRSRY